MPVNLEAVVDSMLQEEEERQKQIRKEYLEKNPREDQAVQQGVLQGDKGGMHQASDGVLPSEQGEHQRESGLRGLWKVLHVPEQEKARKEPLSPNTDGNQGSNSMSSLFYY